MIRNIQLYVLGAVLMLFGLSGFAQTYPPSCVITMPHSNAYFQSDNDVVIKVYSTDIGKSANNGTVSKVEFFNGDELLGEAEYNEGNTYYYTWESVAEGEYTIKAKATNDKGVAFTSAGVLIHVGADDIVQYGMSACKGKYLGNIVPNSPQAEYTNYWNGVTAENSCKWGTVESTKDSFKWNGADVAYNFAEENNLMFRYHAIAWGSQYPKWLEDLSDDVPAFRAQVEEYMAAIAERYTYIDQIDVLNENMYKNTWNGEEHAAGTPYFRKGMGGEGETGYDWVIWLFEKAREYFPNSKLVINDFELETSAAGRSETLETVKVLRDRGLIDGFGTQAHCFNVDHVTSSNLKSAIDDMAKSGLPVYVTELDIRGGVDSQDNEEEQLDVYESNFPVYWEHPAVAGITLWGYVSGTTWFNGTGLMSSSGVEKKALSWMKGYVNGQNSVGYPFSPANGCESIVSVETVGGSVITIMPNPATDMAVIHSNLFIQNVKVFNLLGTECFTIKGNIIDLEGIVPGVYNVVIATENKTESLKLIVK